MTPPVTPPRTRHSDHREKADSLASTRKHLTVDEFCTELDIARSTFDEWRAKGRAPRCLKLPNGRLRIRVSDYESWLDSCAEVAA